MSDFHLAAHLDEIGMTVYATTTTDPRPSDAVHRITLYSPEEALELSRLIDANVGNCTCGTAVFLETAGWCNDQSLPLCGECDHFANCGPCKDEAEEDRRVEVAEDIRRFG